MQVSIKPVAPHGIVSAPPSKSLAHRAVICAALSGGTCRIRNLTHSQDIDATVAAVTQMGCHVTQEGIDTLFAARRGLATVIHPVDCGESGSTLRFLLPLFALTGQKIYFTGRGRLLQRPLQVYADLLPAHGVRFVQEADRITVFGAPSPGDFRLPGDVSSQFVSGLLFALPLLEGDSTITIDPPFESRSYVELTRQVQADFGVRSEWRGENRLYVPGNQLYMPRDYTIAGDYSQAAFLAVLGAACGGITVTGLQPDTLQGDAVILDMLARCGAALHRDGDQIQPEKAALAATGVDLADCPDLGPILMVLGTLCSGTTMISNAQRLRLKESDRIAAMEAELAKFGARLTATQSIITIAGGPLHAPAEPLFSHNDHRIAMSLAVLSVAAGVPVTLDGAEAVNKSWPEFWDVLRQLGVEVTINA